MWNRKEKKISQLSQGMHGIQVCVATVVRPGVYFVCGGGSLCWGVWVCLLLGGREGEGFMCCGSL